MDTLIFPRPIAAPPRRRPNWWLIAALAINAALWALIVRGARMALSFITVAGFITVVTVWTVLASTYAGSPA